MKKKIKTPPINPRNGRLRAFENARAQLLAISGTVRRGK